MSDGWYQTPEAALPLICRALCSQGGSWHHNSGLSSPDALQSLQIPFLCHQGPPVLITMRGAETQGHLAARLAAQTQKPIIKVSVYWLWWFRLTGGHLYICSEAFSARVETLLSQPVCMLREKESQWMHKKKDSMSNPGYCTDAKFWKRFLRVQPVRLCLNETQNLLSYVSNHESSDRAFLSPHILNIWEKMEQMGPPLPSVSFDAKCPLANWLASPTLSVDVEGDCGVL